jgi:asparagine synthetase B (glutamine-hydrolysing)
MNNEQILHDTLIRTCKKYKGMPVALSGGIDSSLLAALCKPEFVISVELPDDRHNEIEWAKRVAEYLKLRHIIVRLDTSNFDKEVGEAVKMIGKPIPHFNILPLYQMYKKLSKMGVSELILGDGPDETMFGYARDLIFKYIYDVYKFPAFEGYKPLIDSVLPEPREAFAKMTGRDVKEVNDLTKTIEMIEVEDLPPLVDINLKRSEMDDMSNGIAKGFGITNHRPYQDNVEIDNFMRDLPIEDKVKDIEFGKVALRNICWKYLPYDIAWRKVKIGGPVFNVNVFKGWVKTDGLYGKESWLKFQEQFL